MKLTIARDDNMVGIDGRFLSVDCSGLPAHVRVVQWDGTSGHVEFKQQQGRDFRPNQPIENVEAFSAIVAAWEAAAHVADNPPPPPLEQLRAREYPPITDLADALYWERNGDPSKMEAYLAGVQAVKDKHPKPSPKPA